MNRRGFLGRLARAFVVAPVLAFSRPERLSVVTEKVPLEEVHEIVFDGDGSAWLLSWNQRGGLWYPSRTPLWGDVDGLPVSTVRFDQGGGEPRGLVGGEQGVGRQDA